MADLILPPDFAWPTVPTALSPLDTMHGGSDEHYLQVGVSALQAIEAALAAEAAPSTILDLPCGFGRVARMLRARYPDAALTLCDLDKAAVDFSSRAFGARGVYSTPNFRDLHLGGTFDLIWVGSLLTHLPEHQTRQFLDFAGRHMGPDSRLVVTSHGQYVAERLRITTYGLTNPAACGLLSQYLVDGYAYRGYSGDPAYGISLAARAWYERLFAGSALQLESYIEQGWDRHQDVLVIRRTAHGGQIGNAAQKGHETAGTDHLFERADVPLPRSGADQDALDHASAAGFDEAYYRQRFADVDAAVEQGVFASGWQHYLAYGWREGRPPFDPASTYAARTPPLPVHGLPLQQAALHTRNPMPLGV